MTNKSLPFAPQAGRKRPLYEQIEADLLERIASGEYPAGSMLPTEHALCEAYAGSRITIRRALDGLANRGLVARKPGRGTTVCQPEEMVKSIALTGYIDDAIPLNRHRVLDDTMAVPQPEVAALLDVPPGELVRRIRSVNHSGNEPLSYAQFYFPTATASLITVEDFLGTMPPVRVIEERSGIPIARAEQVVDPVSADQEVADYLGIAAGTPVLRAVRGYFSAQRVPLEAVFVYYHPQRYRYHVTLVPKVLPVHRRKAAA